MSSKKLRLKRTPAEQIEHDLRKARKAARRAANKRHAEPHSLNTKGREDYIRQTSHSWTHDDSDGHGDVFARVEEERFREKMMNAMCDDDRTGGAQESFEAYGARIPHRWKSAPGSDPTSRTWAEENPSTMGEEEYAEWVREGMWRKKNAAALEEQQRIAAERKAAQAEAQRALRVKDEARSRRHRERTLQRKDEVRATYEAQWRALLAPNSAPSRSLRLHDVPWPVFDGAEIAPDTVAAFLFAEGVDRKEKLRQTLLKFHPDKFEARILARVIEGDLEQVRERMSAVVRSIGTLME